jgi:hypothetical protein
MLLHISTIIIMTTMITIVLSFSRSSSHHHKRFSSLLASTTSSSSSSTSSSSTATNDILNNLRKQTILEYDTNKYPFDQLVRHILELETDKVLPSLDKLHECEIASQFRLDGSGNKINNLQYNWNRDRSRIDGESHEVYKNFDTLYQTFIKEVIGPDIGGRRIIYQRAPTVRVVPPSEKPTGELHRDKDDHHQPSELNYWLLVSPMAYGNNSLWIESEPDKNDFKPVEIKYGQYVRFYGNLCRHQTFPNDTNITRISLDFRCVSDLSGGHDPNFRKGVRRGAKAKWQNK